MTSSGDGTCPSCSIVLATLAGWSETQALVDTLLFETSEAQGEVVVADGSGRPPPDAAKVPRHLRWLSLPGTGIFELRSTALRHARGDVIVVTEDHCMVRPGWCGRILDAHAQYPDVDVIVGRVDNGSCARAIDWASFLVNQLPHVPPINQAEATRQLGIGGVTLKRRAIETLINAHGNMPLELLPVSALRAAKLRAHVEESLSVEHVQSATWREHTALHFHNARAIAGVRRPAMSRRDWLRLISAPALVPYRTGRVVGRALRKELPRLTVLRAAPAVGWLFLAKGAGDCLGYLTGPGDSARRLQ